MIHHMSYDPRASPMCGVLHQVGAFSHQLPKPKCMKLHNVNTDDIKV